MHCARCGKDRPEDWFLFSRAKERWERICRARRRAYHRSRRRAIRAGRWMGRYAMLLKRLRRKAVVL